MLWVYGVRVRVHCIRILRRSMVTQQHRMVLSPLTCVSVLSIQAQNLTQTKLLSLIRFFSVFFFVDRNRRHWLQLQKDTTTNNKFRILDKNKDLWSQKRDGEKNNIRAHSDLYTIHAALNSRHIYIYIISITFMNEYKWIPSNITPKRKQHFVLRINRWADGSTKHSIAEKWRVSESASWRSSSSRQTKKWPFPSVINQYIPTKCRHERKNKIIAFDWTLSCDERRTVFGQSAVATKNGR